MHKMAIGEALPVIDSEIPLSEFDKGHGRQRRDLPRGVAD
jgi:hypothetical protein